MTVPAIASMSRLTQSVFRQCSLALGVLLLFPGALPAQPSAWSRQTVATTEALRSVHFLDAQRGWTIGAANAFFRTADGGQTWQAVPIAGDNFDGKTVRFVSSQVGWIGGAKSFARSGDGGASWQYFPLLDAFIDPSGAAPLLQANAFIPISETQMRWGGAARSPAGLRVGMSFIEEVVNGTRRTLSPVLPSPVNNALSRYINGLSYVPNAGYWFVMDDGGAARYSNTNVFTGLSLTGATPPHLYGIQMLNAQVGYVAGAAGTILKTTNGASWTTQSSGVTEDLRAVFFLDESTGWVVGSGGVILATANGGITWTREASGVTNDLYGIWMVDANTGYVVGANGTILKKASTGGPAPLSTVSAASFTGGTLAAESIAAIFGVNLSAVTEASSSPTLPTTLAGITVRVRDSASVERAAPLFFVSPGQINLLIPANTAAGDATVTVVNPSGAAGQALITVGRVAPSLFAANGDGQGLPAAQLLRVRADGARSEERVAQFDNATQRFIALPIDLGPETDQLLLILYGTGWRNRDPQAPIVARIGGLNSEVLYAGPAPGFPGLDQLNMRLPRALAGRGEVAIELAAEGGRANELRLVIK